MSKPANEWTAREIVAATHAGKVTCEAVTQACLERIAAREPSVQAWQHLAAEQALAQARRLDAGPTRGPLHGVPFGVKDIIDTADMPTEYGSPIHRGHRPGRDAACVAILRRAGAVLVGKTVTTEFANLHPGKTRNPHDPARTPGGSSSGSAAAVADRMIAFGLGTQTTASTIRPASFCGVVGYRPTWGDMRMAGVMEAAGSLDTLGLFARSIEDVALVRDVLLGSEPKPLADAPKPRIGFCRTHLWDKAEISTQRLLEDAASALARAGANVKDAVLPPAFARIPDAHRTVSSYEFTRNFAWEIDHHWDSISETLRNSRLAHGMATSFERYREAREFLAACRNTLDQVFETYDVLLAPAAAGEAPVGLDSTGYPGFCTLWTSTHVPAVTIPALQGPNGLPIGVQLIARRDRDRELFAFARWVQRALE